MDLPVKPLLFSVLAFAVLVLVAAQVGLFSGRQPDDIGVKDGRFKTPSPTRNSVSSQATLYPDHPQLAYASIAPLPFKAAGAPQSFQALQAVLRAMPGMTIVEQKPDYLHAEARTRWLHFVDDLEFWANPASGTIELRSASRLGREDLGVNRERIETIRAAYLAAP